MIISDSPTQLTCPHCGEPKYILSLVSGNTLEGEIWSDTREWYPMLLKTSWIQKCPYCSHYYPHDFGYPQHVEFEVWKSVPFEDVMSGLFVGGSRKRRPVKELTPEQLVIWKKEKQIKEEARNNRFGWLTYKEIGESWPDLKELDDSIECRKQYLLSFLHAYNDAKFGRAGVEKEDVPERFHVRFQEVAKELIKIYGYSSPLTAELLRELECYDEAIEMCSRMILLKRKEHVARQILSHAEVHIPDPFIVQFPLDR